MLGEKLPNIRSSTSARAGGGSEMKVEAFIEKPHSTFYGNPLTSEQEQKTLKADVCN